MEVVLELIMIDTIVRVLCYCLYIVNGGCFQLDNDQNDCGSALPLLVHSEWRLLLYAVNGGCLLVCSEWRLLLT